MKFSIIIPTLNEEKNILSCLSALQPLRNECEIIVVDGESIDNTQILASPLANKVITSAKNRSIQMNKGAGQATGDVMIFLHADTILPENSLRLIEQEISPTRQWGRFDIRLDGYSRMLKVIAWMMNWRSRITAIATGDQVIFVTRSVFEKVGQYPEISLMEALSFLAISIAFFTAFTEAAEPSTGTNNFILFPPIFLILVRYSMFLYAHYTRIITQTVYYNTGKYNLNE
jgi:rSAM/selenodomain-associated transferase 2